MMFWTKQQKDEFLQALKPTVDLEAAFHAGRNRQIANEVANEVNLWLLKKMDSGELKPVDGPDFVARQGEEGYEVREAARNAARRLAGRRSMQAVALDDIEEPHMPEEVFTKVWEAEALVKFDEVMKGDYKLPPKEFEVLRNEVDRHFDRVEKSARTPGERAALLRAKNKVKANPGPMLAKFVLSMLMMLGALSTGLRAAAHQKMGAHQAMSLHQTMGHQTFRHQMASEHQVLMPSQPASRVTPVGDQVK